MNKFSNITFSSGNFTVLNVSGNSNFSNSTGNNLFILNNITCSILTCSTLTVTGNTNFSNSTGNNLTILGGFTSNRISVIQSSTFNALEVRNTGTGHSLFIEDEANPDTTPFIIDNSGSVMIGTSTVDSSALVNISSITKGFLIPRMTTTQKNAISTPSTGLLVYDTTLLTINHYTGTTWASITGSGGSSANVTLTQGVQPNITSLGTLTSLAVSGNISSGNNVYAAAKMGIRQTTPQCVLHVDGTGIFNGGQFAIFKGTASDADSKTLMATVGGPCAVWPLTADGQSLYCYSRTAAGQNNRVILALGTYFTGQHINKINDLSLIQNLSDNVGLIMSGTGNYQSYSKDGQNTPITGKNAITINESLPILELCSSRNDKKVFGVITNQKNDDYNPDGTPSFDNDGNYGAQFTETIRVNGLGEGAIWISNINGNLENGDYITSSEILGHGMRQDDDIYHNYTVAKITTDCDFTLNSTVYNCFEFTFNQIVYKKAFVGCIYLCS